VVNLINIVTVNSTGTPVQLTDPPPAPDPRIVPKRKK